MARVWPGWKMREAGEMAQGNGQAEIQTKIEAKKSTEWRIEILTISLPSSQDIKEKTGDRGSHIECMKSAPVKPEGKRRGSK